MSWNFSIRPTAVGPDYKRTMFSAGLNFPMGLEIRKLEGESFRSKAGLLDELRRILQPSYEDCSAVLARDAAHCDTIYLLKAQEPPDRILAFFMVAWETLILDGDAVETVFLGLSAAQESAKNTGLVRLLYARFLRDAADWENLNSKRLILWCTTGTPSSFNAVHVLFAEPQPSVSGGYDNWGKQVVLAVRRRMGYPPIEEAHPFVLKGVATGTRYSENERNRIERICGEKKFTLFRDLGINEHAGDRLLMVCRVSAGTPRR